MPTSTSERVPSAAEIWASWDAMGLAGAVISDISWLVAADAAFHATYTTLADTVARESCHGEANMLDDSMVNSPPEALACPACSAS
jgi:hypothetical protein